MESLAVRPARRTTTAALIALLALALTAAVAAFLEGRHELARADSAAERSASLQLRLENAQDTVNTLQGQVVVLQDRVASMQTMKVWTTCGGPCTIRPGEYLAGGIPDTFQFLMSFTATVPVKSYIFTLDQFAQFKDCGPTCVSGAYPSFAPATSLNAEFDDAEGCAAYLYVLTAAQSGTITPDVSVRYQPASGPTGVCAQRP